MSQPSPQPTRAKRWVVATLTTLLCAFAPLATASAETTPEPPGEEAQFVAVATGKTETETRAPGIMHSGDEVELTLSFDNQRADAVAAGSALIDIGDALPDRHAIAAWHSRATPATGLRPLFTGTTPALPAGTVTQWEVTIPTVNTAALTPGTYPLRITLQDADGQALGIARTTLTIGLTPVTQQAQALVVLPVVAPSLASGILTPDELAALTAPDGLLTAVVESVTSQPSTPGIVLAIDPAISAAIALRGSGVATATRWLEALEGAAAERFALQFADSDIAAQAAAGAAAPIVPTSLAGFVPGIGSGAEDAPNDPAFFDTAALLTVPSAAAGVFWPRADASAEELATIAGYAPNAVSLVASDSLAEPVASPAATLADGARAIVVDSELSRVATLAATATDDTVRAGALAQLGAMLAGTPANESVVIALDRSIFEAGARTAGATLSDEGTQVYGQTRTPSTADLTAVLETITSQTRQTSLTDLRTQEPTPIAVSTPSNEARAHAVTTVFAQSPAIGNLASAIDQPELLTGTEEARALQVLGTDRFPSDTALAEALAAHTQHVEEILQAVTLDAPSNIQQISRKIELPITVRNSLPYAVNVHVRSSPEDIKLHLDRDVAAVALPHTSTVVKIPIEARVTSAKTSITLQLQAPHGTPIGAETKVPVSVHAQWESVGLVVMSSLIGGLLVIGIIRTIRKKKPATQAADASPEPAETE